MSKTKTNGTNDHYQKKEASSYEQERFEQINSKYVEKTSTEQVTESYKGTNGSSTTYKFHSVQLEKLPLPSTGGLVVGE